MSEASARPPRLINIANVLTGVRLAMVPVFAAALFAEHGTSIAWRLAAFGLFVLASITDRLDGELARRRGLVTSFGTVADPIADKALVGTALVGLSMLGLVPWWITVTIMVREIGITVLRFSVLRHGVIPASRGGKAKTLAQTVAISLYLLPLTAFAGAAEVVDAVRWAVLLVAVVLTVATGLDYLVQAARLRAAARLPDPP